MTSTAAEGLLVAFRKIWPEGAWPCFSPDGGRLVFTGRLDRQRNALMMLSLSGGEARAITPDDVDAKRPAWLSGSEIAFNRGQNRIWTVDVSTGELTPFITDERSFCHPCAYPNERAVVVVSFSDTPGGRTGVLYKLAPGARVPVTQLTTAEEVCAGRPGVSPDGESVVFAGNAGRFAQGANQLWVVGSDRKARRLERGDVAKAQGRAPRWSPDGKWIACTSTRPAPHPDEETPRAVWIISADGREAVQLTDHSFSPLQVAWSPDQKQLACGGSASGLALIDLPERFHIRP